MKRDPRNVPGDFYVERDCCLMCGIPSHFAPDLFGDSNTGCWVTKQPETPDEHRRMLLVIANQELDCVRRRSDETESTGGNVL